MIIGNCPICGAEMRVGTDMTNADRIRNMTDEELATFLNDDWHDLPECRRRAYNPEYGSEECYAPDCKDCWLDWLKQEVSDGVQADNSV